MSLGSFISKAVNKGVNLAANIPGARNVGATVAGTIGASTPAIGPLQTFRNAAFEAAHNATNPAVNIYGEQNPVNVGQAKTVAPIAPVVGQVLGANTGLYSGANGSTDPDSDPTKIAQLRADVGNLLGQFKSAYDKVFGQVDQVATDKANQLRSNYDTQKQNLATNYGDTSQQIDQALGARGALNSSYDATEQGTAKDAFDQAMSGISTSENNDLAGVGQFATQQKAQLAASNPNVNPNDYSSVSDLLNVKAAVDQAVGQLGVTGAGLGTTSQYAQNINAIAPTQETGSATLKAQLDRLAGTNASPEAKMAIASQAISDSGADPNQWLDYFQSIANPSQQPQPATS